MAKDSVSGLSEATAEIIRYCEVATRLLLNLDGGKNFPLFRGPDRGWLISQIGEGLRALLAQIDHLVDERERVIVAEQLATMSAPIWEGELKKTFRSAISKLARF